MRKSRFMGSQIVAILGEASAGIGEQGTPVLFAAVMRDLPQLVELLVKSFKGYCFLLGLQWAPNPFRGGVWILNASTAGRAALVSGPAAASWGVYQNRDDLIGASDKTWYSSNINTAKELARRFLKFNHFEQALFNGMNQANETGLLISGDDKEKLGLGSLSWLYR